MPRVFQTCKRKLNQKECQKGPKKTSRLIGYRFCKIIKKLFSSQVRNLLKSGGSIKKMPVKSGKLTDYYNFNPIQKFLNICPELCIINIMKADQSEQRRRVQALEYLNSVLSDLIENGFNMSPLIIEVSWYLCRQSAKRKF